MIKQEVLNSFIGIRVRHEITGMDDSIEFEYGTIVQTWWDDDMHGVDTYVAFYGSELPNGKPKQRPGILRYLIGSLTPVDDQGNPLDVEWPT